MRCWKEGFAEVPLKSCHRKVIRHGLGVHATKNFDLNISPQSLEHPESSCDHSILSGGVGYKLPLSSAQT